MKKIFYILLILNCSLLITNCFAQWITQNSGTTQHLLDISMINKDTGWVCGESGTILKTNNAGTNWISQVSNLPDRIETIFFINNNTGWAATRVTGKIIKTTNGGNNWNLIFQSSRASFNSMFFLDSLYGWTAGVGLPNQSFRTTNGGTTWDSVSIYPAIGRHIYFFNQFTGWISIGGFLFKSIDGGSNWKQKYVSQTGEIAEFSFINQNTGWFVNLETYRVFKTTDGGNNWIFQDSLPICFNAHSIFFTSINNGWVSGDCGYLYSTKNGGANWNRQQTNTNSFLNKVQFITDSIGWSVGGAGRIIYTNNGGQIMGIEQIENTVPKDFKLYQNFPNPFNATTLFEFDISKAAEYFFEIFNTLGQRIELVFSRYINIGKYRLSYDASKLSSGVYFYKLSSISKSDTKKFVVIK